MISDDVLFRATGVHRMGPRRGSYPKVNVTVQSLVGYYKLAVNKGQKMND